ncbi:hypothetical protein SORBI_3007G120650 [Sorghum bicolor]|uniref:Secreted protein n=1 Tax=Sorghum bicolor TaxID=4558 RepID=A0A1Z5R9E4_SORBI|nr:hypothetical protein SORBI_3007G120650 [Sorghum bicolor]
MQCIFIFFCSFFFQVSLLAGLFDISNPVQCSHFCGRHIRYGVSASKIMFFPVLLQYRWVCFAWRLGDNTSVVYDPCCSSNISGAPHIAYEAVTKLLKSAMSMLSTTLFPWWINDWGNARLELYQTNPSLSTCMNRSGLFVLYFIRCFDGERLSPPLGVGQLQD